MDRTDYGEFKGRAVIKHGAAAYVDGSPEPIVQAAAYCGGAGGTTWWGDRDVRVQVRKGRLGVGLS